VHYYGAPLEKGEKKGSGGEWVSDEKVSGESCNNVSIILEALNRFLID